MRNKLIIEKDKQLIDSLKFKHSSLICNIKQLHKEKLKTEIELIKNLICPFCYSILFPKEYSECGNYECKSCGNNFF